MRSLMIAAFVLACAPAFAQAPAVDWDKETAALLEKAVSDNPFVSLPAYDEILEVGRPCVPGLRAALKDAKPQKRFFAAELLGRIHDPAAVADLVPLLDDLKEERTGEPVAAAAARALGRLADASVGDALIAHLDSTDINVRYECARAVGLLRVAKAEAKLLEIMKKNEVAESFTGGLMPAAACESLGRLRSEVALAEIIGMLDKMALEPRSGWTLDQFAIGALERIAGESKGVAQGVEKEATVKAWKEWWTKKAPPKPPEEPPKVPEPPK